MATKNLVIVESPAKAKTIEKYLGKGFKVKASIGHIIDLPPSKIGVDIENDFEPQYTVIKGKKKVIDELKKAAQGVDNVYLAPDPDREGEAIAWHLNQEIKKIKKGPKVHRVLFNEITKKAVNESILHPTTLNTNMFEAQQARRVLDRLVGYQISPLLWDKVRRGLSAGRVQSVAVRLVCEREEEIKKFVPEEYWNFEVELKGSQKATFMAHLSKKDSKKIELKNKDEADEVLATVKKEKFVLEEILKKDQKKNPTPPFITSKLQQEAARKLGFTAKKTMMLAQKLYEGVDMGDETVGLITYMRTDSTRISDVALQETRDYILSNYGKEYLPETPNIYKSKKSAQDAHECIRPTSMIYPPEEVKKFLEKDELRLYDLIWKRFVASQMTSALFDRTTFIIKAGAYEFRANGSILKFDGFIKVYIEGMDEKQASAPANQTEEDDSQAILPDLKIGEILTVLQYLPSQHFTQPPPRYTEASLVKELEEKGIGRPSTYASILSVIQEKKYVEKNEQKKFFPTDLGNLINQLLVQNFPDILDVTFTASMEEKLDLVETGEANRVDVLRNFYDAFSKTLAKAKVDMKDIKRQEVETGIQCEKCNSPMVIKFGRMGEFLACKGYPECKNTKEFRKDENGNIIIIAKETTDEKCEKCGSPMAVKSGRFGKFLACTAYPECKSTKAISLGINCPECGKGLSARRSKTGKTFYGCTGYPNCKFAAWDKPVNKECPDCKSKYLVEKYSKEKGVSIKCPNKECDYTQAPPETPENTASEG